MNLTSWRSSKGMHPVLKGGLAFVVVILGWKVVGHLNRPTLPAAPFHPMPRRLAVELTEIEPMRIAPDELARAGRERHDNALGMAFCWCPPGSFSMAGGPKSVSGRSLNGEPVWVTLSRGYWIGKYEVTQAQWLCVTGKPLSKQRAMDSSQPRPVGDGSHREHVGLGPDFPIYFTSHADAVDFCRRLTESERNAGRLESGWEYRLPTEAEWEFACRAGTTTATAFGNKLGSKLANFDGRAPFNLAPDGPYFHMTTSVGRYPANAWGLHDMHGNVSEWCLDAYSPKLLGGTDPLSTTPSDTRAFRGGCWYDEGLNCLSTSRLWGKVNGRGSGRGFRVALVSTPS